ncbi:hypothetical protein [Curtobacterium sp. MMLR14_010]|nr:hypothetical protein [Curtobacterium sp. MMLR14_010]
MSLSLSGSNRNADRRIPTTYSDESYVIGWAPRPLLDEADDYLVAA